MTTNSVYTKAVFLPCSADPNIHEQSFHQLCEHIKKEHEGVTRDELEVFRANLLLCVNERDRHCFSVQLKGGTGTIHRSMKQAGIEWLHRKQVCNMDVICLYSMHLVWD